MSDTRDGSRDESGARSHDDDFVPDPRLTQQTDEGAQELQPTRDLSRTPLFQVMLAYQEGKVGELQLAGMAVRQEAIEASSEKFDLTFAVTGEGGGLRVNLRYSTDLYERTTAQRLLRSWQRLLEGVVSEPQRRLSALPLLSAAEHHHLLHEWNDTAHPIPPATSRHGMPGRRSLSSTRSRKSWGSIFPCFTVRKIARRRSRTRS